VWFSLLQVTSIPSSQLIGPSRVILKMCPISSLDLVNQGWGASSDGAVVNMDGHEYYLFIFDKAIDCMASMEW